MSLLRQIGDLFPKDNTPKNMKQKVDVEFKIDERKLEKAIDDSMNRVLKRLNGR